MKVGKVIPQGLYSMWTSGRILMVVILSFIIIIDVISTREWDVLVLAEVMQHSTDIDDLACLHRIDPNFSMQNVKSTFQLANSSLYYTSCCLVCPAMITYILYYIICIGYMQSMKLHISVSYAYFIQLCHVGSSSFILHTDEWIRNFP